MFLGRSLNYRVSVNEAIGLPPCIDPEGCVHTEGAADFSEVSHLVAVRTSLRFAPTRAIGFTLGMRNVQFPNSPLGVVFNLDVFRRRRSVGPAFR
jgi:hypothetical protein